MLFAALTLSCAGGFGKAKAPEPAAIVVDAETGEPIEGAVAMAVWWGARAGGAFEGGGGIPFPKRIEEAVSDKKGRIYIDDFRDWHFFGFHYPHLSVYKCGYLCWNQHRIYRNETKDGYRNDFDTKNKIVRLEKWLENFSYVSHRHFIDFEVAFNNLSRDKTEIFWRMWEDCERQQYIDEFSKKK